MTTANRTYTGTCLNAGRALTIPRKNTGIGRGDPPNALQSNYALPTSNISGRDWDSTVLYFPDTVTGCLLSTELYGTDLTSYYWNDDNIFGTAGKKHVLCGYAENFTIDGRALLVNYPYAVSGVFGTDAPHRADGLGVQGYGFFGRKLRFFQIPGYAIVTRGGDTSQGGAFGIYDNRDTRFETIQISQSYGGIYNTHNDARFTGLTIVNVVHEGFYNNGPGTRIHDLHVYGGTTGCYCTAQTKGFDWYNEACFTGTHFAPGSAGSSVVGLDIGPGTVAERGVYIDSSQISIKGLDGLVASGEDVAGFELTSTQTDCDIEGRLEVAGDSIGGIVRGHHNSVDIRFYKIPSAGTGIYLAETGTGHTIKIRGYVESGGTVLDLSATTLHSTNGLGNVFDLKVNGTAKIKYPNGGGSTYNLAAGNYLYINGALQS